MSGGSLNYVHNQVEEAADSVESLARNSMHIAFAAHLRKVARALHDLEWVLSGDKANGDEVASISACLQPGASLSTAVDRAKEVIEELKALMG